MSDRNNCIITKTKDVWIVREDISIFRNVLPINIVINSIIAKYTAVTITIKTVLKVFVLKVQIIAINKQSKYINMLVPDTICFKNCEILPATKIPISSNIFCDLLKFKLVNTFAEQSIKYPYIMV